MMFHVDLSEFGDTETVAMPQEWAGIPLPEMKAVSDCALALETRGSASLPSTTGPEEIQSEFSERFWTQLKGPAAHAMIKYPNDMSGLRAAALTAAWMGVAPGAVHFDLGGTVSQVISGSGHRHDQSWHTDSTPWAEPNRYSVLAFFAGDPDMNHSTDLLPIGTLVSQLAVDPPALHALRYEPIPWRRNFPQLPNLMAPVLAAAVPRWVWPVLEPLLRDLSEDLRRGVLALAGLVNDTSHYAPVVAPGRLLVFDNWRAMHRGPHLETGSGRELVRIKVGGRALP